MPLFQIELLGGVCKVVYMLQVLFKRLTSITEVRICGAAEGTRTPDPIITNDVLYQLSYSGPWA